ncbi:MAG: putative DNA-binding domain-containing protein [Bacteroidota bacterium]|nr:putative DNA-binding domain-containing protein [Bacteroidota bacterium]
MNLREETIRNMELLGEYSRTGTRRELPGVTPGRIHHYRRLISNVVNDTLRTAFPVTVAALDEETWQELVDEFFSRGLPQTPQVWKLPLEFYQYHARRETAIRINMPFLDDLLYFEWMEIEIHTMPDRPYPDFVSEGDLFKDRLAFNPEYEIVRLDYPVHTHPVNEAINMKADYFTLLYRMPESGHVQFLNLSALNVYIITRLQDENVPLNEIKNEFARVAGIESGRYLDDALRKFLGDLLERKMILGYLRE